MKISVVIPAKNEAGAIGDVVKRAKANASVFEVIVVDDASSDETARVAESAGASVLTHPYSMGNGAAIKTGASHVSGDWIAFMDGDGQHDPCYLDKLAEQARSLTLDMVVASRNRKSQAGVHRFIANSFYNRLASWITEQSVRDLTSGYRLVRRKLFLEFLPLLPNKFSYPTTITMAFFRAGYSVGYVEVPVKKRVGESHISPLKDGMRFLLIIFKLATLYSPLKIFLPVAMFFFFGGFFYGAYTLVDMGRFTNMSALLLSVSVIIFFIGLISEQITNLMYLAAAKEHRE